MKLSKITFKIQSEKKLLLNHYLVISESKWIRITILVEIIHLALKDQKQYPKTLNILFELAMNNFPKKM